MIVQYDKWIETLKSYPNGEQENSIIINYIQQLKDLSMEEGVLV